MKKFLVTLILLCIFGTTIAQLNIYAKWRKAEFKGGKVSCFTTLGTRVIFAATSKGIHVSETKGKQWDYLIELPKGVTRINSIAIIGGHLLMHTPQGMYWKIVQEQQQFYGH